MKKSESGEQQALIEWATLQAVKYTELELLYHIPNEGKRTPATAAKLKREGLKPGVPDLCLPVARIVSMPEGKYLRHGLYIEMKIPGNTPTDAQKEWLERLEAEGYFCTVCYSMEAAKNIILKYVRSRKLESTFVEE